jgi:hypothetical protein
MRSIHDEGRLGLESRVTGWNFGEAGDDEAGDDVRIVVDERASI